MGCNRRCCRPLRSGCHGYVGSAPFEIGPILRGSHGGVFSACELLEQLAHDRVIPDMFLQVLPRSGSLYVSLLAFIAFCAALYASTGASLSIVSKIFTLVWLFVMILFPLSLLLLKFNRGRLPRTMRTSLWVVFSAFVVALVVIGGNIAIDPTTAMLVLSQICLIYISLFLFVYTCPCRYFSVYFLAVLLLFSVTQNKTRLLRWFYWAYDQNPLLHKWPLTQKWGDKLIKMMAQLRRKPVCILAKSDEVR